jgi:uncharacterized membrane protein YdjX (TVP38/TMEM64 family)
VTETPVDVPSAADPPPGGKRRLKLAAVLLLVSGIVTAFALPQTRELLRQLLEYAQGLSPWQAAPLMAALYIPACIFALPGSILTLGSGAVCGLVPGTIAVSLGSTAGATCAFLLGRTLAREWVEARVARNAKFQAIDRAIEKQGFKIVLLLRLSPVFPFFMLNYALGITKVRFRDYVLASWIGMFPGTVMYVYLGSLLGNVAALLDPSKSGGRQKTPQEWAMFGVGLLATIVVAVFVARVAKKAIAEAVPPDAGPAAPPAQ